MTLQTEIIIHQIQELGWLIESSDGLFRASQGGFLTPWRAEVESVRADVELIKLPQQKRQTFDV